MWWIWGLISKFKDEGSRGLLLLARKQLFGFGRDEVGISPYPYLLSDICSSDRLGPPDLRAFMELHRSEGLEL